MCTQVSGFDKQLLNSLYDDAEINLRRVGPLELQSIGTGPCIVFLGAPP
jgi:hypothetical protein